MEAYRQRVENLNPKNSYLRFLAMGILYLVYGLFLIITQENLDFWNSIIWIITGVGFIIGALFQKTKGKEIYIEFNKNGILENLTLHTSLYIRWDDIDEIKIKPISIKFLLKSNDIKEISLGLFFYAQVIEIKAKLKEFAIEKDIKIS